MKQTSGRFGVLGAQCVVCAVMVFLALVLRFVGGNLFDELQTLFCTAIHDDTLGVALMERWQQLELV